MKQQPNAPARDTAEGRAPAAGYRSEGSTTDSPQRYHHPHHNPHHHQHRSQQQMEDADLIEVVDKNGKVTSTSGGSRSGSAAGSGGGGGTGNRKARNQGRDSPIVKHYS
jgi:hypothetical protein